MGKPRQRGEVSAPALLLSREQQLKGVLESPNLYRVLPATFCSASQGRQRAGRGGSQAGEGLAMEPAASRAQESPAPPAAGEGLGNVRRGDVLLVLLRRVLEPRSVCQPLGKVFVKVVWDEGEEESWRQGGNQLDAGTGLLCPPGSGDKQHAAPLGFSAGS